VGGGKELQKKKKGDRRGGKSWRGPVVKIVVGQGMFTVISAGGAPALLGGGPRQIGTCRKSGLSVWGKTERVIETTRPFWWILGGGGGPLNGTGGLGKKEVQGETFDVSFVRFVD